jgi:hypothetical protein
MLHVEEKLGSRIGHARAKASTVDLVEAPEISRPIVSNHTKQ